MVNLKVCVNCGHVGVPDNAAPGSFAMEVYTFFVSFNYGMLFSMWRDSAKYEACSACKADAMIPLDTPRGRQMLFANGGVTEEVCREVDDAESWMLARIGLFCAAVSLLFFALFAIVNTIVAFLFLGIFWWVTLSRFKKFKGTWVKQVKWFEGGLKNKCFDEQRWHG
jgi:hypothetical protein